jgi:hypothetical protein
MGYTPSPLVEPPSGGDGVVVMLKLGTAGTRSVLGIAEYIMLFSTKEWSPKTAIPG